MDVLEILSKNLDILDFNKTIDYLDDVNPDILINCAAEINLDLCESNLNYALKINSLVVQNMAFWCKKRRNLFKYQQINF